MRPRSARFQVPLAVNIDQGVDNRATLPTAPTIGHGSTHDVLHLDHHHGTVTSRTSHCSLLGADHLPSREGGIQEPLFSNSFTISVFCLILSINCAHEASRMMFANWAW